MTKDLERDEPLDLRHLTAEEFEAWRLRQLAEPSDEEGDDLGGYDDEDDEDDRPMSDEEWAAYGAELARKSGIALRPLVGPRRAVPQPAGQSEGQPAARKASGAELQRLIALEEQGLVTVADQARLDEHYQALSAELRAGWAEFDHRIGARIKAEIEAERARAKAWLDQQEQILDAAEARWLARLRQEGQGAT